MKKLVGAVLCVFIGWSATAQERNWAVGFRMGEPLGVNVRKYLGTERRAAIDLNVGTFGGLWAIDRRHGAREYRNTGLSTTVQALWFRNVGKSDNLQAFYGFGAQLNNRREYRRDDLDVSFRRQLTIGGNGIVGLEYRIPERPISIFVDAGLYAEVFYVPLWLHVQGGAGARFHF
jgi:hypothetical protein